MKNETKSVLAYPKSGIAYTSQLYAAAEREGLSVTDGIYSGFWLLENLRRFDAVHLHWPSFLYATGKGKLNECVSFLKFALFLCFVRLSGKRLFWTAHNLYPHDQGSIKSLHKIARRLVVRLATKVFVHGPTAAAIVKKELRAPDSKIVVVQHGNWIDCYPAEMSREAARAKLGCKEDQFIYLFVGLCKNYKNLIGLLEAFSTLDNRSKLVIAGRFDDPDYYSEVMKLVESIPGDRVQVDSGFIPDSELQVYLKACDAVVLPYLEILTSGAAILALGFGRPVVAPRIGYLRDIINDRNGMLYDTEDQGGLAGAMSATSNRKYCSNEIVACARELTWDSAVSAIKNNI